jgi:hypothetical protein
MQLKFLRFFEDVYYSLQACFKFKLLKQCAAKLPIDVAIGKRFSYIFRREKKIFINFFFQVQNLEGGYIRLFESKIEDILFLRIFKDISTKNQYFKKL